MAFFPAYRFTVGTLPVIAYPAATVQALLPPEDEVRIHRDVKLACDNLELWALDDLDYAIAVLWSQGQHLFVDLWLYSGTEIGGLGPLISIKTFAQGNPHATEVQLAESTLLLMYHEAVYRRSLGNNLRKYLDGPRPPLPISLRATRSYDLPWVEPT